MSRPSLREFDLEEVNRIYQGEGNRSIRETARILGEKDRQNLTNFLNRNLHIKMIKGTPNKWVWRDSV